MRPNVCIVASSEMTVRAFLVSQLRSMAGLYNLTVVLNGSNPNLLKELGIDGHLVTAPIERPISFRKDVAALVRLVRLFRRERFVLVHTFTPKAGLLGMLAALVSAVPVRIHTFTGQVWATRSGVTRFVLRFLDTVTARCATFCFVDSPSQRQFLLQERVLKATGSGVVGTGSVSGVDLVRFQRKERVRHELRQRLGVLDEECVFLFVGRLNRDKGVLDLADAFAALTAKGISARLMFVGVDEQQMKPEIERRCRLTMERVHFVEFTGAPEEYMWAGDVLCLPSYREGFGSVVIEAAAAGLPAVASRIYGITDAVEEAKTGLLHQAGNVGELTDVLHRLALEPSLRAVLARAALDRARLQFDQAIVTAAIIARYQAFLASVRRTKALQKR